jgi:hypothetical protein
MSHPWLRLNAAAAAAVTAASVHITLQAQQGSIIVFLGNESPLGTPAQPIVFEQARAMNALVLQVEHR